MSAVEKIIGGIKSLKPMPQVADRIMSIGEDPNSSVSDVADIILYDPSVTANILKLCNSAIFSLPRQIESVREAICFLGMRQIVDLVLLKGGAEIFNKGQKGYGLNEGELWRHAVSSAIITRELAIKKGLKETHMLFTAAILKDIGKLILDRYVSNSYNQINELIEKKGLSFREAEKEIIGIDHAELGGLAAKAWNYSPKMIYIISNHHMSDESARNDLETSLVYLADTVCMMMGIGGGSDGLAYRFHEDVLNYLNISAMDLQEIMAGFGEKMHEVEDLIGAL